MSDILPYEGRHLRPKRARRTRRLLAVFGVVVVIAGVGTVAYGAVRTIYGGYMLNQNVGRVTISRPKALAEVTTTEKPPSEPVTYLLLGNDTRGGRNTDFVDKYAKRSGQGGGGADSIILIRVDPAAKKTEMVSIHRDLRVTIPGHGTEKINSTLVYGSQDNPDADMDPSLMVRVVEQLTGVHIDHVGIVDFSGFRDIVNAVGGVEICLEYAERDKWTGLDLPAGCTQADGTQALAYSRSRHGFLQKDGKWVCDCTDDFGRMRRQQEFLRALAKRVASPTMLTKLPELAQAVKGNIWVDDQLDISDTIGLGREMSKYLDNVATAALPVYNKTIGGASYAILSTQAAGELMQSFRDGTMEAQEIAAGTPESGRKVTR